jgi:hypothetical protein
MTASAPARPLPPTRGVVKNGVKWRALPVDFPVLLLQGRLLRVSEPVLRCPADGSRLVPALFSAWTTWVTPCWSIARC